MEKNQYSDLLLNQTKDLVWAVDNNFYLVYANSAYLNLIKEVTGVEKELNTPIFVEGFGAGYIEKWKLYYQRALSGENFEIEENFFNPETKDLQYGHIAFSPIRDVRGEIQIIACRNTDISPIIRQKDHASRLMDASLDVFCTIDEGGNFAFVSAVSADHWGYLPEELIGTPYRDLIVEEDLEKTNLVAAEILAGKKVKSFSNRYRKKNGDIAYNIWSVRRDHESGMMYCVARDEKDKIEEEQRLKLLEKVINSTTDPILITEAESQDEPGPRIVYVNKAFTKMTGYSAEEVKGKNPRFLQGPDSDHEELRKLGEKLRRWEPAETTVLNYTKTGEPFWVSFTVDPVADEKGWFTHWISIQRDVTDQKKQEAEKELLSQISLSFNNELDLISAANSLCENLYDFGKFDLIELWCPNMEQTQIKLIGHSANNQNFYELQPLGTSFQKNEGLPGKVWGSAKPVFWYESEISKYFIRKNGVFRLEIQAMLGLPLTFNNELVGVLLIGTKRNPDYLLKHRSGLSRLEKFIGSEINRKRLENTLSNVFDAIPEILCITDLEGRFLKINNAGCALLGYAKDEVLFHSLDEFTLKEYKVEFGQKLKDLTKGSSVFAFENRFLSKDGEVIWLSWNCNPALEDGLVYASAKNITLEVHLRELNAQASALAKIGSWEVNLEKNSVFWSKMVHQLHETEADSFIPDIEKGINFYREDFRALVHNSIENSISTGEGFDFEAVLITKMLKEKWVRAIGNVEIINGTAKRLFGSFQDISDRKESEVRLQSLSDDLPGVTFQYVLLPNGKDLMRSVSKASSKIWGLSADDIEKNNNKVWEQIIKGGDFDEVRQSIQKSIGSGEKWHFRWKNVLPTGELRWHEGFGTPNHLANGTVIFNSMIFDITEEKKAVLLYEETARTARLGTWEIDVNSKKIYLSKVTREIHDLDEKTEISIDESIGFYKESFREVARRAIQNGIENGEPWEFELPIITVKGNELWVRGIGQAELFEGKVVRLFGSFQDITEKKESEISLQASLKSLEDYKFALDQTAIVSITNTKGIITSVNDQFCKISQYSREELIGSTHKIINSDYHSKSFFAELWRPIANGRVFRGELKNKAKDGSYYWVDTIIVPFLDENKKPIQYVAIRIDITAKKLANEKIIEVLEEKNQILESIGDAFFAIDKNWTVTYWNKQAEIILGKLKEEMIGKNFWSKFPDTIDSEFYVQYHGAMKTGETVNFEAYYPTNEIWMEVTIYPSETGLSIYFTDVTLRKEADLRLVSANHEKTRILERITEAFVSLDANWCYTYMNKQAGEIFNRDPKMIIGKHIWTEFPEGLNQPFHHAYEKALATQEYIFLEEHYKPYDSWFENHIYPSLDGISIFFRDVTERKRNEEKLKMANERFEKITEATNDAIWDWDIVNDSFYRSQNILKLFGNGTSTKLESKNFWTDSFHPDDLKAIQESISKALKDDHAQRWEMEYRILNEKENTLYVIDRGLILRDGSGKAIRMIGAMTDITERKRSELELLAINKKLEIQTRELERSNEELEQFAFITSHDLQEPLRMISSFMDLLQKKYADRLDDKALQYIYFSIDGAKRMKQIILDLLLYSRANKPSAQHEWIDLNKTVLEYTQLRRNLITDKKAAITFNTLPVLLTYSAPITQIVHCLLDNALKYAKENEPPKIEFNAKEKETEWEFAIKDNGIGIEEMFFEKIFIIFQRLHNRNLHDGTGIGLSVAKRSVEYLGGRIWLESTLGVGTTFYFTISKKDNHFL